MTACALLTACTISTGHHNPGTDHAVATAPPAYDAYGAPKGPTLNITIAAGKVTPPPAASRSSKGTPSAWSSPPTPPTNCTSTAST
nr:hypothetical protein GCM10020093_111120 [Planobispora longispora]